MGNEWPEREGDIRAIILMESEQKGYPIYETYEQNETNGPWYQGTKFFPSKSDIFSLGAIDGHAFAIKYSVNGNGEESTQILGVADNDKELNEKTYKEAVKFCKKYAKAIKGKFINKTKKGLEKLVEPKK